MLETLPPTQYICLFPNGLLLRSNTLGNDNEERNCDFPSPPGPPFILKADTLCLYSHFSETLYTQSKVNVPTKNLMKYGSWFLRFYHRFFFLFRAFLGPIAPPALYCHRPSVSSFPKSPHRQLSDSWKGTEEQNQIPHYVPHDRDYAPSPG